MKRIKRQSINLKAKAIDLQKIKANNAPESRRAGGAAAMPTEGATCSWRRCCRANSNACARCDISADSTKAATSQRRSNGRRRVDSALYGPSVCAKCWSRQQKYKKKAEEEAAEERLAVASDWLLNSLTTLDASRHCNGSGNAGGSGCVCAQGCHVCERRVAKLPGKLGRLHAAKV